MRLTLRTLLAYLDDRLSPANAREIGQKITASPFAQELVDRIREVIRRRRLANPEMLRKQIDPNLVAEYLDDVLTAELVAQLEKQVLASDVSLAEVAATHQVLGLIGNPVQITPALRDRLYGLDPSGRIAAVQAVRAAGGQEASAAEAQSAAEPAPEWEPLETENPLARRLPVILVGVLAVVWLGLLVTDHSLFGPNTNQPDVAGDFADTQPVPPESDTGPEPREADEGSAEVATVSGDIVPAGENGGAANATEAEPASSAVATTDVPGNVMSSEENVSPAESDGTEAMADATDLAGTTPEGSATEPAEPPAVAVNDPPAEPAVPVRLAGSLAMTLHLDVDNGVWSSVLQRPGVPADGPERAAFDWRPLLLQGPIAVPNPFAFRLIPAGSGVVHDVAGPTLIYASDAVADALVLAEGRIVTAVDPTALLDEGSGPSAIWIVGGERLVVIPESPETRFAVEAVPTGQSVISSEGESTDPNDEEGVTLEQACPQLPLAVSVGVQIHVTEGTVQVIRGDSDAPSEFQIGRSQSASWIAGGNVEGDAVQFTPPGQINTSIPAWVYAAGTAPVPEVAELMKSASEVMRTVGSPAEAAVQLTSERLEILGSYGTSVLSVMRDINGLISVLFEGSTESLRRGAIEGLIGVTLSGREAVRDLEDALLNRFPKTEVPEILNLIRPVIPESGRDPVFSQQLVDALLNERLIVRELAFYQIEMLTGQRYGYSATDQVRRRDSHKRWERQLERNNGRLLP